MEPCLRLLEPRAPGRGGTLQNWLYMAKYPPSLAFLLWTLGGLCFLLALGLLLHDRPGFKEGVKGAIHTIGRVPLFFYCTQLWLYRLRSGWMARPPLLNGLGDDGGVLARRFGHPLAPVHQVRETEAEPPGLAAAVHMRVKA